ncbi:hypothetical protein A7Q09_03145 [Methylacidiphilum sp. Yel]|uniref:polymer-forming cytoskeletal protein n=1 Tax=Methylacidiphilum sp. Yel TaxID=1847730 RepID=UPI00106D5C90|nr:polymer-forming cytoskeletal protein [Methylacidiphilum sp. Yel]TFE70927.1 hypothetical protein A7Q09_03145 [Methylacidiphilum sp. Yel]
MQPISSKRLDSKTQLIRCPACGHSQVESRWALSTICKKCFHYIGLATKKNPVPCLPSLPSKTREITCPYCHNSQKIYPQALSVGCAFCGAYLYVENLCLKGKIRGKISTLGDIDFEAGSEYVGATVQGRRIRIRGIMQCSFKATEEVEFCSQSVVKGIVVAPRVIVNRFSSPKVKEVITYELIVKGQLECETIIARDFLKIESFGKITTKKMLTNRLVAELFSRLEADFETYSLLTRDIQKNGIELGEERLFLT